MAFKWLAKERVTKIAEPETKTGAKENLVDGIGPHHEVAQGNIKVEEREPANDDPAEYALFAARLG